VKERLVGAIVFELLGVAGLMGVGGFKSALMYLLFHAGASFLITTLFIPLLPRRYWKSRKAVFVFFWSFIFFSGPVGFIGGLVTYFYLWKKKRPELPAEKILPEELPIPEPEPPAVGEAVGDRLDEKLVIYLMKFTNPVAIKLLKRALASKDDEVRLLAFTVITNTEKEIMDRIYQLLDELEKTWDKEERFNLLSAIGEMYWELVYLNIADEELKEFYLKTALDYVMRALSIKEEGRTLFLAGRIHLKLKDEVKAEYYFLRAVEKGFPFEKVAPYLMEVYYNRKNYERVFEIAERVKDRFIPDMKALSIVKVWA